MDSSKSVWLSPCKDFFFPDVFACFYFSGIQGYLIHTKNKQQKHLSTSTSVAKYAEQINDSFFDQEYLRNKFWLLHKEKVFCIKK